MTKLTQLAGTRQWVVRRTPYVIVYEVGIDGRDEVMIPGVFHGCQDR